MKRRIFIFLCILSLLLCIGIMTMWGRSYRVGDRWSWSDGREFYWRQIDGGGEYRMGQEYVVKSVVGQIQFIVDTSGPSQAGFRWYQSDHPTSLAQTEFYGPTPSEWKSLLGFEIARFTGFPSISSSHRGKPKLLARRWIIPYWFPAAITSIMPIWWFSRLRIKWRRQHRLKQGLCVHCGYDLRASPERCPECGLLISPVT